MTPGTLRMREWRSKNPERAKGNARAWKEANREKVNGYAKAYRLKHPENTKALDKKKWLSLTSEQVLFRLAKHRAKILDVPFDLTVEDIVIPNSCPCLGIILVRGVKRTHDASPTLDRLDPLGGYTRGNVWVISFRANAIKRNASPQELTDIALAVTARMKAGLT